MVNQGGKSSRIIVTVIGTDKIGIIAKVTEVLAQCNINILDIRQTIMQEFFTMLMVCDLAAASLEFNQVVDRLNATGDELGVKIVAQHEDAFRFMHRI